MIAIQFQSITYNNSAVSTSVSSLFLFLFLFFYPPLTSNSLLRLTLLINIHPQYPSIRTLSIYCHLAMSLLKLPTEILHTEILHEIANLLPTETDINNLVQTSRHLHYRLNDYLYRHNIRNGSPGFFYAVRQGYVEAVQRFLECAVDPNVKCLDYNVMRTPLGMAVYSGHIEIAQVLLMYGADPNERDGDGEAPLFPAVRNNDGPMVDMLLRAEADPNVYDCEEPAETPLDLALRMECDGTVEILLNGGAGSQS